MKTFATLHKASQSKRSAPQTAARLLSSPDHHAQRVQIRHVLHTPALQTKLKIGPANDKYEREADRMADHVMRMPSPAQQVDPLVQRVRDRQTVQRTCAECEDETLQRKSQTGSQRLEVTSSAESRIHALRGEGQPLPKAARDFFEPRFDADFSHVRVHHGTEAAATAQSVQARAFTHGNNVVFGAGEYSPHSERGKSLLAHELTHVVQQGAAPSNRHGSANESGQPHTGSNESHGGGTTPDVVQRWPGDGMVKPGDCSWARYIILRGSVESAKAVVSMMGGCRIGDSCLFLATKIAAVTAEIAARIALMTACYKGGDTTHRKEVNHKVNFMKRCYKYFTKSNCSPELITAMTLVVARARRVIESAALGVALALVVALVVAIIALAKVIAAAIAAAAAAVSGGALLAGAAAAVIALLIVIKNEISPGGGDPPDA